MVSQVGQHLMGACRPQHCRGESATYPEGEGMHGQAVRMSTIYEPPARHACTSNASVSQVGVSGPCKGVTYTQG